MRSAPMAALGVIVLLAGVVFTLQGAGMAGSGSFMDNNATWIYVGGALAVVGLVLLALGARPSRAAAVGAPSQPIATP